MENIYISDLRKKNRHIGIRVSSEERVALEHFCKREQISFTDFFRIAIRNMINEKTKK